MSKIADKLILQCDCHSAHFLILQLWEWPNGEPTTGDLEILGDYCCENGWWQRLKGALKILFGIEMHYAWASLEMHREQVRAMREFLERIEPRVWEDPDAALEKEAGDGE